VSEIYNELSINTAMFGVTLSKNSRFFKIKKTKGQITTITMKTLKSILLIIIFCLLGTQFSEAQVWNKLKKSAEKAAERAIIRKTEQKVTKETERAMDSILNPKTGKMEKKPKGKNDRKNDDIDENSEEYEEEVVIENPKVWSKYNFVPGDEIVFQDDLMNEENGEFPSRWDLISGSVENAVLESENIINLENNSIITPLLDEESYLPEVFTIEFDAYFYSEKGHGSGWQNYNIRFSKKGEKVYYPGDSEDYFYPIILNRDRANLSSKINGIKKTFEGSERELDVQPVWRHFAIAFNKRSLKVFIDEHRVLNVPNLGKGFKPQRLSIMAYSYYDDGYVRAIKNIRIAKGGKKLYDRVLEDGKFVTRGILFDVNKATIKKESYGVLNEVAKMMKEHKNLNFKIEGHTDSDGEDEYNLKLSADRAVAVKTALQEMGISKYRFQTVGKGETTPVSENNSPEGKANNRRVEFIKITE